VVIAHAADRTGAPMTLLHQLRWLRQATEWELVIVLLRGGPLLPEFRALGDVIVIGEPDLNPERTPAIEADDAARREQLAGLDDAHLVYVNTAWSIHGLPFLPPGDRPVLAAIHELDHDLRDGMPPASLATLLSTPDHFIAGAEVIAANLRTGYDIPADRISVVPEAIAIPAATPAPSRAEIGLPDDAFVVMAAGSPAWRKAPDLFVFLADRLRRVRSELDFRFRWLGADPVEAKAELETPLADRQRLGLAPVVEFVPPTDRVMDQFRAADVFVLPSREDANPLVCLEAAAVGRPVVCFDNGGIPEALGEGCVEVAYPDLPAMAGALSDLADDPERRRQRGEAAAARVRQRHDIERTGPRLRAEIERWLP
jgi:glycosyltransferase involved in cell wall biosynthesis